MFQLSILKSDYEIQATRAFILKLVFSKSSEHQLTVPLLKPQAFSCFLWFFRMKKKGKAFWKHIVLAANKTVAQYELLWKCLSSSKKQTSSSGSTGDQERLQHSTLLLYYSYFIFPWRSATFIFSNLMVCLNVIPPFHSFSNEPSEKILPQLPNNKFLRSFSQMGHSENIYTALCQIVTSSFILCSTKK